MFVFIIHRKAKARNDGKNGHFLCFMYIFQVDEYQLLERLLLKAKAFQCRRSLSNLSSCDK